MGSWLYDCGGGGVWLLSSGKDHAKEMQKRLLRSKQRILKSRRLSTVKKEQPGDVAAKNEVDSNNKSESDEVQEPAPEAKSDLTAAANAEDASDDDEEGSEGDDEAKKNATDAEMVDAPSAMEAPSESQTLFMGNLSFSIEKSHVVDFFKDTAEVVEVRFAKKNGRLAGYGYVDFASPDAAQKALKLNGELLLERAVKLDLGQKKDPSNGQTFETANLAPSDSKTWFIGNLSYSVEESHIVDFFKDTAEVVEVRFAKKDGRFAGFGHVDFPSPEAAQKALKLNGELLLDRAVKLDLAKKRDPSNGVSTVFVKGFGTEDGFDSIKSSLEEHFKQCGEISRISIPKDFESGGPKGVAVSAKGEVYTWGFGRGGRLGHPDFDIHSGQAAVITPGQVTSGLGARRVKAIAAAKHHTVAVTDGGEVFTWVPTEGQLGYTSVDTQATPRRVSSLKSKIVAVAAANKHTAVVSDSGEVFTWGCNKEGQLGYVTSNSASNYTPRLVEYLKRKVFIRVSAAKYHTMVLGADGEVWAGPLSNYRVVVLLVNRGPVSREITAQWDDIGLPPSTAVITRDLWLHTKWKQKPTWNLTATVASHGCKMFVLKPVS